MLQKFALIEVQNDRLIILYQVSSDLIIPYWITTYQPIVESLLENLNPRPLLC